MVNCRTGPEIGDAIPNAVAAQGCASANMWFRHITSDESEIARLVLENGLLGKIMAMR